MPLTPDRSDGRNSPWKPRRLRPSGGFRRLRTFQAATVIYDAAVDFCNQFVDKRTRTHDQMVQAARSGRQNIAEGSRAAAASSSSELRLTQFARASLDELLLDFEDFLRQRASSGSGALPRCPLCARPMTLRTACKGPDAGQQFWGCSAFPACRATVTCDESVGSDRADP